MTNPRTDDRDMDRAVQSWLTDEDERPVDRNRQIGRIMGRVDETRQRRRLWPLNPFGRRAMHSATGTGTTSIGSDGTAALVPIPLMTAVVVAVLVTISLLWVAARPQAEPQLPGGPPNDAADEALFDRLTGLWAGEASDLATTLEVYADDAVHTVLWLDDSERISGNFDIWDRMRESAVVDLVSLERIRLVDDLRGAHRYLWYPTSIDGTICVVFTEEARVTRHDCILATSIEEDETPTFPAVPAAAIAEREALSTKLTAALDAHDRKALEAVVSADVAHHVHSDNQVYTIEGITEYAGVMSLSSPKVFATVDLPAPEGQARWASFANVGGGSLCVFWAQDGLITRHDCVVPGYTTVSPRLVD